MNEFRKFTKNENQYVMKTQYGFGLVVVAGMAAFTIGGIYIKNTAMIWIFGVLTVLCLISIFQQSFSIDMDRREFVIKNGLINKPVQIPITDFINFELVKVKQNLITTNVSLNLYYRKDNKEKCTGIAQGFTTKSMQILMNEINDIIELNEHSRKI
ncbi:hypothetical protein K6T82_22725 [Flavobacterium sp. 17A]|uniref:Uncharacterized protein n=1 Tax=Flavobacterium potami TaxID=2872310 RepID=A0A9X1HG38_9FLAO|nr:hypothetical protein [Flavobacterium potami]MBZ4037594.1 hypothetical protein [Flavobacterium potami]